MNNLSQNEEINQLCQFIEQMALQDDDSQTCEHCHLLTIQDDEESQNDTKGQIKSTAEQKEVIDTKTAARERFYQLEKALIAGISEETLECLKDPSMSTGVMLYRDYSLRLASDGFRFCVIVVDYLNILQEVTIKKFEKKHGKFRTSYHSFQEIDHNSKDYERISKYKLFQRVLKVCDSYFLSNRRYQPSSVCYFSSKPFRLGKSKYEYLLRIYNTFTHLPVGTGDLERAFEVFEQIKEDLVFIKMIDNYVKQFKEHRYRNLEHI